MEIHLISALCIVIVGLIFGQPYTHGLYQAVTNEAPDQSKIEENVHNFFDSIAKKNTKMSGAYHEMLEKQVVKEHQAFDAMNEELQSAQNKNFQKRKSFYRGSDVTENLVAKKRETDNTGTTTARQFTVKPPVDLSEIGFKGSWERFCDKDEIDKDSPPFLEHPLRTLRLKICYHRDLSLFTPEHVHTFASYKYSVQARSEADALLDKLVEKFSDGDDKKRAKLFMVGKPKWNALCFRDSQEWLRVLCVDSDNPYNSMFYELMTRVCSIPGLSPTQMRQVLKTECEGVRLPKVQWEPLYESIHYKDHRDL